jgi:hypothetical protein
MISFPHYINMSLFELSCDLQRGVTVSERDCVLEDAIMLAWAMSDSWGRAWS